MKKVVSLDDLDSGVERGAKGGGAWRSYFNQ